MNPYDEIERYVSGEMDAGEQALFEARLQDDQILRDAFNAWQETEAIVQKHQDAQAGADQLHTILAPITKQYFSKGGTQSKARVVHMGRWVAAAMAIAAITIFFLVLPGGVGSYTIDPMPGATVRGVEDDNNKGAQLFNGGKYAEALPLLQKAATARPADATLQYYYGIALIKNEKYTIALPVFEQLTNGASAFKEDSYFFAALAAYKAGEKAIAIAMAEKVNAQNRYYKNAQKILDRLR